jgi:hypothetical protein
VCAHGELARGGELTATRPRLLRGGTKWTCSCRCCPRLCGSYHSPLSERHVLILHACFFAWKRFVEDRCSRGREEREAARGQEAVQRNGDGTQEEEPNGDGWRVDECTARSLRAVCSSCPVCPCALLSRLLLLCGVWRKTAGHKIAADETTRQASKRSSAHTMLRRRMGRAGERAWPCARRCPSRVAAIACGASQFRTLNA